MAIKKKRRKFTKENWEALMASVKPEETPPVPEAKKEDSSKVEVHIHNNMPSPFHHNENTADRDLESMMGNARRRFPI